MEPTDLYNKSKRNLAVFTAFLALVLFGRVTPEESGKLLGFKLAPEAIPTILFFVVAYLLYQFILARVVQRDDVRNQSLVKIDFLILTGFSTAVLFVYLGWYLPNLFGFALRDLFSIVSTVMTGAAAAYTFWRLSDFAKWRRDVLSLRKVSIAQRLKEPGWVLNFNSSHPQGKKAISFNDDGTIAEGRNSNEFKWKLERDQLVIIRENGDLQNRFTYIPATDRFISVDDPNAKGFKPQSIFRSGQGDT